VSSLEESQCCSSHWRLATRAYTPDWTA